MQNFLPFKFTRNATNKLTPAFFTTQNGAGFYGTLSISTFHYFSTVLNQSVTLLPSDVLYSVLLVSSD